MRIGWKQYFQQMFTKHTNNVSVGIAFTADQVLLCVLDSRKKDVEWILDASFSHKSWPQDLQNYVVKRGLTGAKCYFALSSHWYRTYQIDKPNVQGDELKLALQYPLQEIAGTDIPLVYDYAEMPIQVAGQNKLFVVAVAQTEVEKLTQAVFDAKLVLEGITVEEFATIGLVDKKDEAVITLVQEHGEVVVLNIVKNNQLFFSRRLSGFENIGGFSESELQMGISDSICVQIQRSMDFFESQLRQAPIKTVLLKLDSPHIPFLCAQISNTMGVKCVSFEPNIICTGELNFKLASFSCLGAAYLELSTASHSNTAGLSKTNIKDHSVLKADETKQAMGGA